MHTVVTGHDKVHEALVAKIEAKIAETPRQLNEILRQVAAQERMLLGLGSHPRGTKTGSPPGSPPWRISGNLQESTKVRRARLVGPNVWEGMTGPTAIYARIQELGGDTGRGHRTHLPPRPHLRPAWDLVRPTVSHQFKAAWG